MQGFMMRYMHKTDASTTKSPTDSLNLKLWYLTHQMNDALLQISKEHASLHLTAVCKRDLRNHLATSIQSESDKKRKQISSGERLASDCWTKT